MAERMSLDGKLYYGTAGSQAATELTNVQDVTLTLEKAMADTSRRAGAGWETSKGTLKSMSIEFTMIDDSTDAALAAIKDAWLNNTLLAFYAKDAASGEGPDADFDVVTFNRNEALREAITYSVTIKAAYDTRAPTWS